MHAVVSLLDEASDTFVPALWAELDREFGVRSISGPLRAVLHYPIRRLKLTRP